MSDLRGASGKTFRVRPGNFSVGSMPFRAALRALVMLRAGEGPAFEEARFGTLDPVQAATVEGVTNPLVKQYLLAFLAISRERTVVYELPPDNITAEEIRHRRAVNAEIDRLKREEIWESTDPTELKHIAEENLRAQKTSKKHGA